MRLIVLCVISSFALTFSGHAELTTVESDATIEVKNGEATVLVYNKKPTPEASENDPMYSRTGYIHPVFTPSGKQVTDDFAPDHPHQHGLFFAWTKTSFEGRAPEFWNQKKKAGNVRFDETIELLKGEKAGFVVSHVWEDLKAPDSVKEVLRETWKVIVTQGEGSFLIDLESTQQILGGSPLVIEKYHYGGMAIRGNREWMGEEDGLMLTSEGFGRTEGNHTRPKWVKMSGLVNGAKCGVLAIPDPKNFRSPQWVRLHPSKPYFVFAPMVEESFEIVPGTEYVSKFRFIVFDGDGKELIPSE